MSNTTVEMRKLKAVELLSQLDIHKPYIKGFVDENRVCFFERFGGFYVDQEQEIFAKMQEIEKEYNCTVYAITHEHTSFGELWDFLLVTDYEEEWCNLVETDGDMHYCFAYVWNKSDDYCSEFGTIGVRSFGGGITRVG